MLGDSQNAGQAYFFQRSPCLRTTQGGSMRSKACSIGVLAHLRSVSLTRGRLLERARDTR